MIARYKELSHLRRLLRRYPAAGIIGARQVGKTTLAREFLENRRGPGHMFDLEDPQDTARLREHQRDRDIRLILPLPTVHQALPDCRSPQRDSAISPIRV